MNLPKHIEHWDDERSLGHGIIVTLVPGLSFNWWGHEGVMGFDTVTEARRESARKRLHVCDPCSECDWNREETP
jgi:hypothetical protein